MSVMNSLRDARPPMDVDRLCSEYREDCLSVLRWLGIVPQGEIEDFFHGWFLAEKRLHRLEKWNGSGKLSNWLMKTWRWHRYSELKAWRGNGEHGKGMSHGAFDGFRITNSQYIDQYQAPTWYAGWQCHGPDSTSEIEWNVYSRELRDMMPDTRYQAVFDGLISDQYQNEIAEELDESRPTISMIATDIRQICSEKGWGYREQKPHLKKHGYVPTGESKNVVGKTGYIGRPKKCVATGSDMPRKGKDNE